MKIYFYAKSGHAIGLESTKKCAAIYNLLKKFDPLLCTSDFRAGAFAKEHLGVKKYVNIDVIRNLTNIMEKNDILLYSSDEVTLEMKNGMKDFCSLVYSIDEDLGDIIVDKDLYSKNENPKLEKTLFFGDDDYNNELLTLAKDSPLYEINLLIGHYFFLGNEKILKNSFSNIIDEEEYVDTIKNSKFLLTASLQTALESLSCGNNPVIFKRKDKIYNEELILKLNIPIIDFENLNDLIEKFESIIKDYPNIKDIETDNCENIINEINEKISLYNKLMNI